MKKILVMLFIGLMVCGIPGVSSSDQGVTKDSVKIESLVDITGPSAVWGAMSKKMGDMWAAEYHLDIARKGTNPRRVKRDAGMIRNGVRHD